MPRFWPRALKTVLPVGLACGAAGYLYAVAAGAYVADNRDDGTALRDAVAWRVPFATAFWGAAFTLVVEVLRHLWAPKGLDGRPAAAPEADAEKLLLEMLEQAEEAERSRTVPPPAPRPTADSPSLTDTPLPASLQPLDGRPVPVA